MKFSEVVRDPVHGLVRLEEADMAFVDSLPFQRLRHISQLGLTNRVYPGACHSRFEHALGTMEVTTRLLEEMKSRLGMDALLGLLALPVTEDAYEGLLRVSRLVALLH
ncbi:MAG: HD domain-containing protein, partial [Planctomycetota bacterium]|nr:HD domain-containing protein [Planctomycetota bacterium]